jgi:hypothetical protein
MMRTHIVLKRGKLSAATQHDQNNEFSYLDARDGEVNWFYFRKIYLFVRVTVKIC